MVAGRHQPLALVAVRLDFLVQLGGQKWNGLIILGHDVTTALVWDASPGGRDA